MSTKNKIKILIPNILTGLRLILTPFIILLGFTGRFKMVIILIVIGALTDLLDGKLARYLNTVSNFGAKLDTVSDKVFGIGLLLAVLKYNFNLLAIIIFEIIIGSINLYFHFKTGKVKSLLIGKIKTVALFITIIVVYLVTLISKLNFLLPVLKGLIYVTINLQILSILYYLSYNLNKNETKIKNENK